MSLICSFISGFDKTSSLKAFVGLLIGKSICMLHGRPGFRPRSAPCPLPLALRRSAFQSPRRWPTHGSPNQLILGEMPNVLCGTYGFDEIGYARKQIREFIVSQSVGTENGLCKLVKTCRPIKWRHMQFACILLIIKKSFPFRELY